MTVQQAYKIFDVRSDITKMELKKRYRRLMHMVHPDAVLNRDKSNKENVYRYSAYEINEAYTVLFNQTGQESLKSNYKYDYKYSEYDEKYYGTDQENEEYDFTAPENEHAFCQRNVYHYAEDYNGNNIGRFKVARGRYMWMPDEDFRLFLRSIYECSEELLNRIDEETGRVHDSEYKIIYQAELAYLLAQQFTATSDTLGNILTSIDDAANVFYVGAMLEMLPESGFIKAGMKLFPAGIKKHRLYLMTRSGKEAGYISFKDDRLYYVLIPILEQKRAMVKIEVSSKQDRHNTMGRFRRPRFPRSRSRQSGRRPSGRSARRSGAGYWYPAYRNRCRRDTAPPYPRRISRHPASPRGNTGCRRPWPGGQRPGPGCRCPQTARR